MTSPIAIAIADNIATLTMDVPDKPMNVVTPELRAALGEAIEKISADENLKGVIVTSGKTDFLAGGDLKAILQRFELQLSAHELYEMSRSFGDLIRQLETCGKPVAAAVNGLALGGGFELALACHYRVVANLPKIILGLPEATLGLMPGAGGTQRLARMLGAAEAIPILVEGRVMKPCEALELKLVDEVVPADQLLAAAREWILRAGDSVQRWEKSDYKVPGGTALGSARLGTIYNQTAAGISRDTQRNRPAPIAILSAVARGLPLPMDAALRVERREFVKLMMSPITRNIIRTQFVSKGEAEKLIRRPQGIPSQNYGKIGILGAGLMGSGIAQVSAIAGLDVVLLDATQEDAGKGLAHIAATFNKLVERGKMPRAKADAALAHITATADYSLLTGVELVIEAVFEDREVKKSFLKAAHGMLGDKPVYASNTSTIPITDLATAINRQDRFLGMRFFSPVDRKPLVELVKGQETSNETLAHALDFIKRIRKTPIIVNDSCGFFTNRVFSAYLSEVMGMLAEGIDPALIENGARQAGLSIGPLTLIDEVTIEIGYAATNQARKDLGDAWNQSPVYPVWKLFVEELERKGRRYGKGFYDYPENGQKRLWKGLADIYPPIAEQPPIELVKQRLLYIQALEATRCLEKNVIEGVADGDVGSTLGIGFPLWTGGVFSLIDTVGVDKFLAACEGFAKIYGERWRPSELLKARAAAGESMYPAPKSPKAKAA